jgi:hypothetical protein
MSERSELHVTVHSSPPSGEVLASALLMARTWKLHQMEVEHS